METVNNLINYIINLIEKDKKASHYAIAKTLNENGKTTLLGKQWTAQNLRLFMTNRGITHKANDFSIKNVIKENRLESMRLI